MERMQIRDWAENLNRVARHRGPRPHAHSHLDTPSGKGEEGQSLGKSANRYLGISDTGIEEKKSHK